MIPLLKNVFSQDVPNDQKQTFNKDVIERVQASLGKLSNTENVSEINSLIEELQRNGHISDKVSPEISLDRQTFLAYSVK